MVDYRTVDVAGTRLACQVSGPPHGPPLVLLHAMGEDAGTWDVVAPVLARRSRVYAIDLRGHARSDWPGTYSLDLMKDDVLGSLDVLGLRRVDLVGHSMGGIVAYLLAEDRPRRVGRLVLEDVPLPRPREPSASVRPEGELSFDWELVRAIRRQIDRPDPRWLERLGLITARTLVVAGGPGSHVPQDGVAELARRIPGGRLLNLPVGHQIHRAAPEAFTRAVGTFLSEEDEVMPSYSRAPRA
ncbi:alpha/beta fold hydrolase [Streptomyces tirandamycinicus]|uniref:alpha/beta fold hydrolase n=1 Tax=Streptomyces tirandamycinicus TaxID=2174846 RepID=UPI00226FA3C5|nr:alpha/beta fold hydrolase [Streptomyces tirandamycinicus]MCY0980319.1 alpha/beta fold hydrolase [Streptomyces tirandamycinicus]